MKHDIPHCRDCSTFIKLTTPYFALCLFNNQGQYVYTAIYYKELHDYLSIINMATAFKYNFIIQNKSLQFLCINNLICI